MSSRRFPIPLNNLATTLIGVRASTEQGESAEMKKEIAIITFAYAVVSEHAVWSKTFEQACGSSREESWGA